MDLVYILTTDVCCYQYDYELAARTQFMYDRRFAPGRWTRSERRHYERAQDIFDSRKREDKTGRLLHYEWWEEVFDQNRAREPGKTLVEIPATGITLHLLWKWTEEGSFKKRGERVLALSFFHNDEDTESMMYGGVQPGDLVQSKISWLETFMKQYPFIRTVEIPYDFTLTEEYLRGLFDQYVLS